MYYVYIVKGLKNGRFYIGFTNNIARRLEDHNRGKSRSVRSKGPFALVHHEIFDQQIDAIRREKQIKSYKGGEAFKKLLSQ